MIAAWRSRRRSPHAASPLHVLLALLAVASLAACGATSPASSKDATATTPGKVEWNGWTTPVQVSGVHSFYGVSCVSATFCMAVASDGEIVRWDGRQWSLSASFPSVGIWWSVSCTSATFCMAVGAEGSATMWHGASWSTPIDVAPGNVLSVVSCSTSTLCYIGDSGSAVIIWYKKHFEPASPLSPDANAFTIFTSASCLVGRVPWKERCVFSDTADRLSMLDGTKGFNRFVTYGKLGSSLLAQQIVLSVSCVRGRTLWCAAIAADGTIRIYYANVWTKARSFDSAGVIAGSIACVKHNQCVIATDNGSIYRWADGAGYKVTGLFSKESLELSLSCPSLTFCALVNGRGEVSITTNPFQT